MNDVCDPNTWFIYARVLESGQEAVAAAGVGAVVAHNLPSARQQEQEQADELTAAPRGSVVLLQPFSGSHPRSCKI